MADIFQVFQIKASPERVYEAICSTDGVRAWWSLSTKGRAAEGALYELDFGPGYAWEARVTESKPPTAFAWELTKADGDWLGTQVGFQLEAAGKNTLVHFRHTGWPTDNTHYRTSCYCWAMYLRILKRYVEYGEFVPYADRLDV